MEQICQYGFFGNGDELTVSEKVLIRHWLKPLKNFIHGDSLNWGTSSLKEVRCITFEGNIEIKDDELWEDKLELWNEIKDATRLAPEKLARL